MCFAGFAPRLERACAQPGGTALYVQEYTTLDDGQEEQDPGRFDQQGSCPSPRAPVTPRKRSRAVADSAQPLAGLSKRLVGAMPATRGSMSATPVDGRCPTGAAGVDPGRCRAFRGALQHPLSFSASSAEASSGTPSIRCCAGLSGTAADLGGDQRASLHGWCGSQVGHRPMSTTPPGHVGGRWPPGTESTPGVIGENLHLD